ncbi:MAG: hypothetical protein JOZ90_01100 [Alphaproteobacteria bacterium]|nr:hypothetical protein [Alphaproteobacteria bacterium]MBV9370885.1 hypothetical protein [Alphaproteobacteria bacterium]MBV9899675.1 hypothetical protein [Alphaproteobacteria bacterium]
MKRLLLGCLGLSLAGCDSLPRDPDHTLERVRSEKLIRVGVIADGGEGPGLGAASAFLGRVARATGARPALRRGASEALLLDLEAGKLDLVLGTVSPDSPWAAEVAILHPLAESAAPQHLLVSPIARNGENRWIMLLEREADSAAAGEA